MGRMILSHDERAAVEAMRAKKAAAKAADDFQRRAIATALAFMRWSKKTGDDLTFSTFVNAFGYQQDDVNQMYAAVVRIREAAWPQ